MFSPPLKKSIVFLKYALKMDLVKGEWFDLYALIEERQEKEMLKKLLLINNQFPNEMKKFLEQFEVEETDTEFMEKIRIEIGR